MTDTATVHDDRTVTAGETRYSADRLIIATGARPAALDIPGVAHAKTSDDVFRWTTVPDRTAFLGGGYIGCELASIFRAFGSEVFLPYPGDRLLARFAKPLGHAAQQVFEMRGIKVMLRTDPDRIDTVADSLRLHGGGHILHVDRVVSAVGRRPNIDHLGGIIDDLIRAESGALAVDARLETSQPGIFAIGDAADRLPLMPVATRDGDRFARMLLTDEPVAPIDLELVASAAFVMPPVAQVGDFDTSEEAGNALAAGAFVPNDQWTTRTVKLVNWSGQDGLKGAGVMAEAAADLIAPFAALRAEVKGIADTDAATGVHPTFGEEVIGR